MKRSDRLGLISRVEAFNVPPGVVDLARRRTEFLLNRIVNWDMPIKQALANSYVQGMNDAMDVLVGQTRKLS